MAPSTHSPSYFQIPSPGEHLDEVDIRFTASKSRAAAPATEIPTSVRCFRLASMAGQLGLVFFKKTIFKKNKTVDRNHRNEVHPLLLLLESKP